MTNYVYSSRNSDLDWIITVMDGYYELRLLPDFGHHPYTMSRLEIEKMIIKTSPRFTGKMEHISTLGIIRSKTNSKYSTNSDIDKIENFIISYHRDSIIGEILC